MEELYDNIENYLSGKLPKGDRDAFEKRLKNEASLQEEVDAFRLSKEVVELSIADQLRNDFKSWDKEDSKNSSAKIVRFTSRRNLIAIAASLILLSFVFINWRITDQNYNSSALAAQYHTEDFGATRSSSSSTNVLAEAQKSIQTENYPLAIEQLQAISDTSASFLNAQLLLADVYFINEQFAGVNTALEPVLVAEDLLLKEKAEWLQLLTLLKEGKKNESEFQALLDRLSSDNNHSFHPKAKDLKATLDGFWVGLVK